MSLARRGPSAQNTLFIQVCSLKELLTNFSNSLNCFLITYANTPEFLSKFFFPLQGHLVTTAKVSNIDVNIRKEPQSTAETLQFILETCSSFLTAWLQLQFSFSLRQAPYADCYTEMTLNLQAWNREAIFNSTVRWKCVLEKPPGNCIQMVTVKNLYLGIWERITGYSSITSEVVAT